MKDSSDTIYHLPNDIFPGEKHDVDQIIFHKYAAPMGSFKGKSILTKNAISLVIKGEKTMHFAEKVVFVNPTEFHFLSAGNCLVSMQLSEKTSFESFLIFFDTSVLTNFYLKYDLKISTLKQKHKLNSESYLAIKKDKFVWNFITSLELLHDSETTISNEMKLLKFEELILHLLENYPAALLSFQPVKKEEFDDSGIRKIVERNIGNTISLEELAFLCNVSLSTFKRRFAKIYNTSPKKWFLQKRMELAKDLLSHHSEKPGEVFYKVGYQNHSSFSQSFKQLVGLTPKEFQRQRVDLSAILFEPTA